MSQIFGDTGSTPSADVEFLSGQTGTNPVGPDGAHNINIFAEETTDDNLQGINTRGDAPNNTIYVQLTNRISGFISTNDAVPTTIITFPLGATPGTYRFMGGIEAYESATPASAVYGFQAGVRTTGAAGVLIAVSFDDDIEEAAMATADFDVTVVGNNLVVTVTGIALTPIDWRALVNYRFVE